MRHYSESPPEFTIRTSSRGHGRIANGFEAGGNRASVVFVWMRTSREDAFIPKAVLSVRLETGRFRSVVV